MKLPWRILLFCVVTCLAPQLMAEESQLTSEEQENIHEAMEPLHAYALKLETIRQEASTNYLASLDALIGQAKKAEQFSDVLRIQDEKEAWQAHRRELIDYKDAAVPHALRKARYNLQHGYLSKAIALESSREEAVADAQSQLKKMEADLVKKDRFASAAEVAETRKQLEARVPPVYALGADSILGRAAFPFAARDVALYINFEDQPTSDSFLESSAEGHTCVVRGKPSYELGPSGMAARLSEADDYFVLPSIPLSEEITIMGWVKHDKPNSWGHMIKLSDAGKKAELGIYTGEAGNDIITSMSGSGVDNTHSRCRGACEIGTWMHLIVTCTKKGDIRIYKNGRVILKDRRAEIISPHARAFGQIGRDIDEDGDATYQGVYGAVDEIVILRRALGGDEARRVYLAFGGQQ